MTTNTSSAPWVVAAAALVVAVVGGAWFLSSQPGSVGSAVPSPTVAPSPTATPAASPAASTAGVPLLNVTLPAVECPDGSTDCMAAGTYALGLDLGGRTLHVDVPAGWFPYVAGAGFAGILVDVGPDAPDGSGWGVVFMEVGSVYRDPCDAAAGTWPAGEMDTPDELVAAMRAWPGFEVSDPTPTTVAGADGVLVEVTSARSLADCEDSLVWQVPLGSFVDAYPMVGPAGLGRAGTFRIVDVGDELLVVRTTAFGDASPFEVEQGVPDDPTRHTDDLPGLQSIVDSARFAPETP